MRKFLAGMALVILSCNAQLVLADCHQNNVHMSFDFDTGYRCDHLKWAIAGPPNFPRKILSTLTWRDLDIYQLMLTGRLVTCGNIYIRTYADYGWIYDGHHHHNEFADEIECDKITLSSRAKANKGEVFDGSFGIGYYFSFLSGRVTVSPIGGYSYHAQHLNQNSLFIEFDEFTGIIGPEPGLKSHYKTRWFGWWAGFDFTFRMTCYLWLQGGWEYHWVDYQAHGHWNLRRDFLKDFKHHAHGHGEIARLGMNYDFGELWCLHWTGGILGTYNNYFASGGKDCSFTILGPVKTKLRRVRWHSWSLMGSIAVQF